MALTRMFDEWPLLIVGPVLRRVSRSEVTVFAATSAPCNVQLVVNAPGTQTPGWVSDTEHTRTLGQWLHVVVCHIAIPAGDELAVGVNYEYDLTLRPDTGPQQTLADQEGLLTGPEPLGYQSGRLPSFSLPDGLAGLNLFHSSCRKPHGGGPDALAMIDRLIKVALEKPGGGAAERPHQLLLTGDQIYSDDVAIAMLATLQEAGALLLAQGMPEQFPDKADHATIEMSSYLVKPGHAREEFLKTDSTLSSDHGMNHLMYLAEFCAMYVMCWSDELWPRDANGRPTIGPYPVVDRDLRGTDAEQRKELTSYAGTVRRVRRALANVPTMMMFDDHEISDDWNLDKPWFDASRTNPPQKRVVRNGLLAYAVFQAWGNDPTRFTAGAPKKLLDAVTVADGATSSPLADDPFVADVPLDLTTDTVTGERMTWSWTLDGTHHLVVALDSRTRRDYTSIGALRPGLLTPAELDRQLTAHEPKGTDTRLRFVIAPAPVVGHPFVETKLQPLMRLKDSVTSASRVRGGRAADFEAWSVNRVTYQSVLRRLAQFGRVVVLSGDVHYGYTNHTAYFGANGLAPARIVQLCASAAKNADSMTRAVQGAGLVSEEGESWLGMPTAPGPARVAVFLGAFVAALGSPLTSVQKNLFDRIKLFGLLGSPALVPFGPWRTSTAQNEVALLDQSGDPSHWRYRTTFIWDDRNGAKRLDDTLAVDPRTPSIGALHVIKHANRVVVGEPNVGQVRVVTSAGATKVVHRLHFMTRDPAPDAAQTYTEHIVPLDAPTAAERPHS